MLDQLKPGFMLSQQIPVAILRLIPPKNVLRRDNRDCFIYRWNRFLKLNAHISLFTDYLFFAHDITPFHFVLSMSADAQRGQMFCKEGRPSLMTTLIV